MGTAFFQMAELVGSWSKDPSTQVGAVITEKIASYPLVLMAIRMVFQIVLVPMIVI